MPVRAVLHAVSRAVSPVPKPAAPQSSASSQNYSAPFQIYSAASQNYSASDSDIYSGNTGDPADPSQQFKHPQHFDPSTHAGRDPSRYQPPEPRFHHAGAGSSSASSIYDYGTDSWASQGREGRHDEQDAPPLPPRRPEPTAIPSIAIQDEEDYAPPPGPPPGYLKDVASTSSSSIDSPSPAPSTPKHTLDWKLDDIKQTHYHHDIDESDANMKLGELIPALIAPHLPPRPGSAQSASGRTLLPKPIAIPSVNTELGSPYMRAYAPCLEEHGIPRDTFLRFLDRLNRVSAASPPVVMLGLGASVVSLIPEPTTAIVATAVDLGCQLSVYAISKGRTEMLLAEVNKEIFGPRGLKVQIAKVEAVAKIAGIPVLDDEGKLLSSNPDKNKKKKKKKETDADGIVAAPTRLLAPLEDVHEVHTLSAQHRRVRALAPWTMPLIFDDLPDVYAVAQEGDLEEAEEGQEGGNGISAMGKLHQYVSDYQRKTGEEKLIKDRKKALDRLSESRQKARERFDKKMRELEKEEVRLQEKITKKSEGSSSTKSEEKELDKIIIKKTVTLPEELDKELDKIQRKYEKEDAEEKGIRRVHYLIVTDKDDIERQTEAMDADQTGDMAWDVHPQEFPPPEWSPYGGQAYSPSQGNPTPPVNSCAAPQNFFPPPPNSYSQDNYGPQTNPPQANYPPQNYPPSQSYPQDDHPPPGSPHPSTQANVYLTQEK